MYTNLQLAQFAQKALLGKARYWYGTYWQLASIALYDRKRGQYPGHYTGARADTYRQHIRDGRMVTDCAGLVKGFFWSANGTRDSMYADGFPDCNANAMLSLCDKTGSISGVPDVPGLILWTDGHLGVTIGGGYAIEARGFSYGVVKTRIRDRNWKKWGRLKPKYLEYVDGSVDPNAGGEPVREPAELGGRLLRRGMRGEDVRELQRALTALGFGRYLGTDGADGDFGPMTDACVRAFQKAYGLKIDGEYSPKSHARLISLMASAAPPAPVNPAPLDEDDLPPEEGALPDAPDSDERPDPDAAMGAGASNPYPMPTKTKRLGMKGAAVRWIQWALIEDGFPVGKDGIDGDFGPNTDAAVRKYQKAHGLLADGEVGPLTRAQLAGEPSRQDTPPDTDRRNCPDISYYDGMPDWSKVSVPHVWIREGDSLRKRDPEFSRNVRGAARHGVPWSAYLFFRAHSADEAVQEADAMVQRVKQTGETPVSLVLDVEVDSVTKAAVRAAHARLRELMGPDAVIGLYIGHHLYASFKPVVALFDYIWIPRYNSWRTPPTYPYDIWQGGFGSFSGIRGGKKEVDCNRPAPGRTWAQTLKLMQN